MNNSNPHRINLSRRWQVANAEKSSTESAWIDLQDLQDDGSEIQLLRRFNLPTNLTADSTVVLCFAGLPPATNCCLNGIQLGKTNVEDSDSRFEITEILNENNFVVLKIVQTAMQKSAPPLACLEITEFKSC